MNKKWLMAVLLVIALVLVAYAFRESNSQPTPQITAPAAFDPFNTTYIIEGQSVALVDGQAEIPAAPGSATKITTTIFGEPIVGDLNRDGKPDAAIMLVQNPGGSGTFYYVAAAINSGNGAEGTNAILLGDRIAPQNIQIQNGQIIANYADRKPGEPMTAQPSLGVSRYFVYAGPTLREVSSTASVKK